MSESAIRVRIEFKRVQTFLFEVPRLRAMVGANVLLGELLRYELPEVYRSIQAAAPRALLDVRLDDVWKATQDPLSEALGSYWQQNRASESLEDEMKGRYPSLVGTGTDWFVDNPANAYAHGVLARDGGHFAALFDTADCARQFVRKATERAATMTPGIRLQVHVDQWAPGDPAARKQWRSLAEQPALTEVFPFQLPVFARCPELPNHPVEDATEYWQGDRLATTPMSYPAALRYRYGKRYLRHEWVPEPEQPASADHPGEAASSGNAPATVPAAKPALAKLGDDHRTLDMASLLRPQLPLWEDAERPPDFESIAGGRYLAVIHMDGNAMGQLTKPLRDAADASQAFPAWLLNEYKIESLFHQARTLMRTALVQALQSTIRNDEAWVRRGKKLRPYQLLMQGGDDVLLVCRADRALPLVVDFARALQDLQASSAFPAFGGHPLTVGAGVVIAKPSLPFHRLHELAEELAGSAKTMYRSLPHTERASVVDWAVTSNAWAEDPASERARSDVVSLSKPRRLLLSRKPYRVLSSDSGTSLESLLSAADRLRAAIATGKAARSQLKSLEDSLAKGEALGTLAWKQLPKPTRDALVGVGVGSDAAPWDKAEALDNIHYVPTRVLDLVEIVEIDALGRQSRWSGTNGANAQAPTDGEGAAA